MTQSPLNFFFSNSNIFWVTKKTLNQDWEYFTKSIIKKNILLVILLSLKYIVNYFPCFVYMEYKTKRYSYYIEIKGLMFTKYIISIHIITNLCIYYLSSCQKTYTIVVSWLLKERSIHVLYVFLINWRNGAIRLAQINNPSYCNTF